MDRISLRVAGCLVGAALASGLGWFGYQSWKAAAEMAVVTIAVNVDPVTALIHNSNAVGLFPFPVEYRRQFSATLAGAIQKHAQNMQLDQNLADGIWKYGETVSPYDTTALMSRAQVLLNYGPLDTMPEIIRRMKKVAPNLSMTWLASSYYAMLLGDNATARKEAEIGLPIATDDEAIQKLTALRNLP